jgi:hypothetical protein
LKARLPLRLGEVDLLFCLVELSLFLVPLLPKKEKSVMLSVSVSVVEKLVKTSGN